MLQIIMPMRGDSICRFKDEREQYQHEPAEGVSALFDFKCYIAFFSGCTSSLFLTTPPPWILLHLSVTIKK